MTPNLISIRPSILNGEIKISGSKNAALPIIVASVLLNKIDLRNIPNKLLDIQNICQILISLGSKINIFSDCLDLDNTNLKNNLISEDLACKTRASFWFLAPMLARFGKVTLPMPGGCKLNHGSRMIDMHIAILSEMSAQIEVKDNIISATLPQNRFNAVNFSYPKVSVGATVTGIMAAVTAIGTTYLYNCAKEPEIVDLCNFLNLFEAKIEGIGTENLIIEGVEKLNTHTKNYSIISDRIEAMTYAVAVGATGGELKLTNIDFGLIEYLQSTFESIGIEIENCSIPISKKLNEDNYDEDVEIDDNIVDESGIDDESNDYMIDFENNHVQKIYTNERDLYDMDNFIIVRSAEKLSGTTITTEPYPGFSTDLQPQMTALLTIADGKSHIYENIFDNRLRHNALELKKMGAKIELINDNYAIISPVAKLHGATVIAQDLRGAAALLIAGLIADDSVQPTIIENADILDRGYEDIVKKLSDCGARIEKLNNNIEKI